MKKLETLNNSLFERFENNKVNNLALCLGGTKYVTTGFGGDTFDTSGSARDTMYLTPGQGTPGDCYSNK